MNDPVFVCGFESFSNLLGDRQCLGERNPSSGDAVGQRLAFDQFEDESDYPIALFKPVDVRDVGVIQ